MIGLIRRHEKTAFAFIAVLVFLVIPTLILYLHSHVAELAGDESGGAKRCSISTTMEANPLCPYVDLVYTWVNGTDPIVLRDYKKVTRHDYVEGGRTRDFGTFLYSVRAADTFAPWIRQVVIVTNGQVPTWLNTSNPRVRIVTHSEIFANVSDLPTFNSNAIEANIHRIPGVAPCFFYQNDDFGFGRPVCISDYVDVASGAQQLSFDHWAAPEIGPMSFNTWHRTIGRSNSMLNEYYNPHGTPVRYHYEGHNTRLFRTEVLRTMAERWPADYARTSSHRFRTENDVAIPFLFNNVVLEEFGGVPNKALRNANYYGNFMTRKDAMVKEVRNIRSGNYISWCLNDIVGKVETEKKEAQVKEAVEAYAKAMNEWLPLPSDLEKVAPGTKTIQSVRREKAKEHNEGTEIVDGNNAVVSIVVGMYRLSVAAWAVMLVFFVYVIIRDFCLKRNGQMKKNDDINNNSCDDSGNNNLTKLI